LSGIVALCHLQAGPVSPEQVQQMTQFMAYRGPDSLDFWVSESIGLGHTLLRLGRHTQATHQPLSLRNHYWIVADARLDGRDDLIQTLQQQGCHIATAISDAEVLLHAYDLWGDRCVDHLLGDFAFIIWDQLHHRLLAARDHFGIKPLYFAQTPSFLIISNTLNCVRSHPDVKSRINEMAIADFLVFGHNQELYSTAFAAVQRLPPAHLLVWQGKQPVTQAYWRLPTEERLRFSNPHIFIDRFQSLFQQAIADRIQGCPTGILMSGGMDSTSIAAIARHLYPCAEYQQHLQAYTVVYDRLFSDSERYYSGLAAQFLKLPQTCLAADDYPLYHQMQVFEHWQPEPTYEPLLTLAIDQLKQVQQQSRILLTGRGGDPALLPSNYFFLEQLCRWRWLPLAQDIWMHLRLTGKLPTLGLRSQVKIAAARLQSSVRAQSDNPAPKWINQDFLQRLDFTERCRTLYQKPELIHRDRREAYSLLSSPAWSRGLECQDPGVTGILVEQTHPFLDVRLVTYLLALSPIPWFVNKLILRVAMRPYLPRDILKRPKTPLTKDPLSVRFQEFKSQVEDILLEATELEDYINREVLLSCIGKATQPQEIWRYLRPFSLMHWLRHPRTKDPFFARS